MKRCLSLTFALLACSQGPSLAQTIVNNTTHPGIFAPNDDVTVVPPPIPFLTVLKVDLVGTQAQAPLGTYWNATATGGAILGSNLLGEELRLAATGAQVELENNSLQFNINNPPSLLGALGVGLSLNLQWQATATFNGATLRPNTTYRVVFDVDTGSGLLASGISVAPRFEVQLIDGAGGAVGTQGGGTLVNVLGLDLLEILGAPTGTERATAVFRTGTSVPSGSAGVRFLGGAVAPISLGSLTNFATISNLQVSAVDPYTEWVEGTDLEEEDWDPNADPDGDGRPNIQEFAQDTDPASGQHGDVYSGIGDPDGSGNETSAFVMTIAVRDEVGTFGPGSGANTGDLIGAAGRVSYRVEGSFELETWNLAVSEVTLNSAFITPTMRTLQPGWRYRSFRIPGETKDTPRAFLRVVYDVNP